MAIILHQQEPEQIRQDYTGSHEDYPIQYVFRTFSSISLSCLVYDNSESMPDIMKIITVFQSVPTPPTGVS